MALTIKEGKVETVMDDFELLERWLRGELAAGDRLCARHLDTLHRYFRARVGDAADDLVQATFLQLAQDGHRFEGRASVRTYLFALARHQLCAYRRRSARAEAHLAACDLDRIAAQPELQPGEELLRAEREAAVREAVAELPHAHKQLLDLYYWQDVEVEHLARELRVSPTTVRTRLFRVRAALRGVIDGLAREARMSPAQFAAAA